MILCLSSYIFQVAYSGHVFLYKKINLLFFKQSFWVTIKHIRSLLFLPFSPIFKRAWLLYRHIKSSCFSVCFFLNQFLKVISSDLSFVRPHRQFTFLFSFLETSVYHYTRSSSHPLQKNRILFIPFSPFCFQGPIQLPLLSKTPFFPLSS